MVIRKGNLKKLEENPAPLPFGSHIKTPGIEPEDPLCEASA
jgi:hypothetical protein